MPPIDSQTQLCAVIGHPVAHSLSPAIHNAAFQALGINFAYLAFDVTDIAAFLNGMRATPSFRGLSVTIPHKLAVIAHLDEVDPMALHVGSVNTITNENGKLIGSSTDGPGTLLAFAEAHADLNRKRVLFLGTGGAVRAVAFAVAESSSAESVTILGRTPSHVDSLVADLTEHSPLTVQGGLIERDLEEAVATHDILVNGTPIGMAPNDNARSPVPKECLRPGQTVFDMVYRPLQTQLIRDAQSAGCNVILGREMLIHQAALQFTRWTGQGAPLDVMRDAFDSVVS